VISILKKKGRRLNMAMNKKIMAKKAMSAKAKTKKK
jgi:hypothetical protein